ncbi:MAG TPA: glycosyltransferase [Acidimicrobiales bacterium]|nr:glycosyltransferase [Acidimicrobiales bacterium]
MTAAFPDADLYALTWNRSAGLSFGSRTVTTTLLDRVPPLRDRRMFQLPLMPLAWRYASRRPYDVVVTSSHSCAKGFWPGRAALHLCYCYTPMRYLWLSSVDTRRRRSAMTAPVERRLRSWDLRSSQWVDDFAAISTAVATRIDEVYGRTSTVIHPPVDTDYFTPDPTSAASVDGGFALAVSRMVPYKRLDLAIRACHRLRHPLVVAGAGPEEASLRALAADLGADVRFVVAPDDGRLRELYRAADLLVFPAEEDFGIVPVEAQACGTPVVALARGGCLDTVVADTTGVLVAEQTEGALAEGVAAVLEGRFGAADCRRSAQRFSRATFDRRFVEWVTGSAAARGIEVGDRRAAEAV